LAAYRCQNDRVEAASQFTCRAEKKTAKLIEVAATSAPAKQ
jgi:hypothetical protein